MPATPKAPVSEASPATVPAASRAGRDPQRVGSLCRHQVVRLQGVEHGLEGDVVGFDGPRLSSRGRGQDGGQTLSRDNAGFRARAGRLRQGQPPARVLVAQEVLDRGRAHGRAEQKALHLVASLLLEKAELG